MESKQKKKTPLNIQSNTNKKNNLFLCIFFVILASTYCKATPENFSLIFCIIKNWNRKVRYELLLLWRFCRDCCVLSLLFLFAFFFNSFFRFTSFEVVLLAATCTFWAHNFYAPTAASIVVASFSILYSYILCFYYDKRLNFSILNRFQRNIFNLFDDISNFYCLNFYFYGDCNKIK